MVILFISFFIYLYFIIHFNDLIIFIKFFIKSHLVLFFLNYQNFESSFYSDRTFLKILDSYFIIILKISNLINHFKFLLINLSLNLIVDVIIFISFQFESKL